MELNTPRLKIREFRLDDFDALYEIDSDPRVCLFESIPLTADQVQYRLEGSLEWAQESPRTIYKMAVTMPPADRVMGRLTIKATQNSPREWEIGWTMHPDAWGRGLATEGALAIMDFGFRELKAHRVVAFCHADHSASVRVMERLGMQREGCLRQTIWLNENWHDELLYSILETEFFERSA